MKKEGFSAIVNSKDAKVNTALFLCIALIFLMTVFYTQAMSIKLLAPLNNTYNNSIGRNVNFTFNVTWDRASENQSNCTLYINTTSAISGFNGNNGWVGAANRTNGTGINANTDGIINNSISYINYTFSTNGNFTWNIGCLNSSNGTQVDLFFNSTNLTFFLDSSAPQFNFTVPDQTVNSSLNTSSSTEVLSIQFKVNDSGQGLNMTINNSINLSIFYGGAQVRIFTYINRSDTTNLSCSATNGDISTAATTCNATYRSFTSNGTYLLNISAMDALGTYSTGISSRVTVDQIPPYVVNLTICTNETGSSAIESYCDRYGASAPSDVQTSGGSGAQGKRIFVLANFTDNLTQPSHADLQFFNVTANSWQTVNTTNNYISGNITNAGTNTNASINFSFMPSKGRNEFEGKNITFRILVNDTLGNRNTNASHESGAARNITVNINDTTKSAITINGTVSVNGSNLTGSTATLPLVSWSVIETSGMAEINVSLDGVLVGCNKFKRFTTASASDGNADAFRNSSFTPTNDPSCTLVNGSHFILVQTRDTWGNIEARNHTFTVQSGGVPALNFSNVTANNLITTAAVNETNLTSSILRDNVKGLGFYGLGIAGSGASVANLSYVSSCDSSTTVYFQNNTVVFPFNASTCPTTSGNRSLKVTVTDTAGNSNATTFGFLVDNVAPSIYVYAPTNGQSFTNSNVSINFSAIDQDSSISFVGYYLDNVSAPIAINTSTSGGTGGQGVNNTYGNSTWFFFTPGTHTLKLTANDSLGNVVNATQLTFTITGPLNFSDYVNTSLLVTNTNISFVNLTDASGETLNNGSNSFRVVNDSTWKLFMDMNGSQRIDNVTVVFNGSAANWDRNFTFLMNNSLTMTQINNNFTSEVQELIWFDKTIHDFLPNNNSYYGIINYRINNASQYEIGGKFELWYFPDIDDVTAESNLSECAAGFSPSFTASACWNYTDNSSIRVYLPHFSGLGFVNNSAIPLVNVTTPALDQLVGMFVPNISVTADAISCKYSINSSVSNKTMTLSSGICLGSTERFNNTINNAGGDNLFNITFTVTDSDSNVNNYLWQFNVSDTAAPNVPNLTAVSASGGTTTATITISGINESVNATVYYGTSVGAIVNTVAAMQTDFNASQDVEITGLTASTTYHFNVTICDNNGNCAKNGTFNFSTSSAASSSSSSSSSSSGGGGGGGGGVVSNVEANVGRVWDQLAAGSTATLTINNQNIAFTAVIIGIANAVSNPSLSVDSLKANPYSTAAAAKVFQYLQITKSNFADLDTSSTTINFRVPKSWLVSNGASEDDIVLYRYSDGQWNPLPTTKSGSDADYVSYQSTSPGTSTFAIGTKEAAPTEQPPTTQPPTEQPPTTPTEQPPTAQPSTPTAVAPEGGLSRTSMGWIVVLLIVVAAGIGYFAWQKRKGEY